MPTITQRIRYIFEGNTADLEQATKKTGRNLEGVKRISEGVGGKVGELSGRVTALGEGFSVLGGVAGPLAIAGAGMVAVAASAVAVGVGLVKVAQAVEGVAVAAANLEGFDNVMGPEHADRVERVAASFEALRGTTTVLASHFVTTFEPVIVAGMSAAVEVGLRLDDVFDGLGSTGTTLANNLRTMSLGITLQVEQLGRSAQAWIKWADIIGIRVPNSAREAAHDLATLSDTAGDRLVEAFGMLGISADRGRNTIDRARDAFREMGEEAETAAASVDQLVLNVDKVGGKKDNPFDKAAALTAAALQSQKGATEDAAEALRVDYMPALSQAQGLLSQLPSLFEKNSKAQRAATVFGAVSNSIINGALGVSKALSLGPAGIPLAGLIGGLAAANTAIIGAEASKFHTGGTVGTGDGLRMPGMAPDERLITALVGEEVRTRGQQGGGAQVTQVFVGGRELRRHQRRARIRDGFVRNLFPGQRRYNGAT